jgi:xanthine dehydrogenase YagS FAD-binding subunit
MRPFHWSPPASLDDALTQIGQHARPLAGGTDLLTLMNGELASPQALVPIRKLLPSGIHVDEAGVHIGAGTPLSDLEGDAHLASGYTALSRAAALAASPQLRNMATVGGNLLQRPRCWYFRHRALHCWLKGGDECLARHGENREHAIFGDSPCVAAHPSDVAPALIAFDADVRLRDRIGERTVPVRELFALPEDARRTETTVHEDELILDIRLPRVGHTTRSVYLKAMDRAAFSFALVGVAAVARLDAARRVEDVRLVLAGVAPIPWRLHEAEEVLRNHVADRARFDRAADKAVEGAFALSKNEWKRPLVRRLIVRALTELA